MNVRNKGRPELGRPIDRNTLPELERQELEMFLDEYSSRLGRDKAYLEQAFFASIGNSSIPFETALSRMKWLIDTAAQNPIALLSRHPELSAQELAQRIVDPRETVLEFIASFTVLDRAVVDEIYSSIRATSRDPYGLPDLSEERILQEMKWWLHDLEFPPYYFETMPPAEIAHHILVNRFYELQGLESESYRSLRISYNSPEGTGIHWVHRGKKYLELERELESAWRAGGVRYDISVYAHAELYLYIVRSFPDRDSGAEFASAAPGSFTREADEERYLRYRALYEKTVRTGTLCVERSRKPDTGEYRLMIGFPARSVTRMLTDLSRLLARSGMDVHRKYLVTFGGPHPVVISSFYADRPFPEDLVERFVETGLYPDSPLAELTESGALTPTETAFAHAAAGFVHTFITRRDANLELLEKRFGHDPGFREAAVALGRRLAKETYPLSKIEALFHERPEAVKQLYALFSRKFDPAGRTDEELLHEETRKVSVALESLSEGQTEREIYASALSFVECTLRTNFFLPLKSALAFRLSPRAIAPADHDAEPYGIFYIKGREFTGFHVRFSDIARGGIRIVRSGAQDEYRRNADTLFEECFNLARTQNRKNKDIPEGGAKGVILPEFGCGDQASLEEAFMKYIDALLDMILPENRPFIAGWAEELLFLGPDEGTAELMDAACSRARARGYAYWKAFTTGKSAKYGGISHIAYGMTTTGIHRYVLGILRELDIDESSITKIQTGGPDGDLGSNEILVSRDRTIAVVDGGGVLYDPDGIDRGELERLAHAHLDCSRFDTSRLGPNGFLVKVTDRDLTLPDGTPVATGFAFRNGFHLGPYMQADLFVPCGGRPASINSTNWQQLLDANGRPRVRFIVEGANLFITQEARLKLEERGVILFKDSSTNKGGVTSSSLEVLAGLALTDEEFDRLMCAESEAASPEFRARFIREIIGIIRTNADAEFSILRRTHNETGTPISELSDRLSARILELTREIDSSGLYEDRVVRRNALALHLPPSLRETIGIERLEQRIPESYLRAIFARTVARELVYEYGISPGYEAYRLFIERLRNAPRI
jgi:glutamate dehydrogenase